MNNTNTLDLEAALNETGRNCLYREEGSTIAYVVKVERLLGDSAYTNTNLDNGAGGIWARCLTPVNPEDLLSIAKEYMKQISHDPIIVNNPVVIRDNDCKVCTPDPDSKLLVFFKTPPEGGNPKWSVEVEGKEIASTDESDCQLALEEINALLEQM